MVDLLSELVAIPAIAPEYGGDGESEKVAHLEKRLREMGFTRMERLDAPDDRVSSGNRPNLILWLDGRSSTERLIVIVHSDVVPAGNLTLWKTDPFKTVESDGRLFGRGVEDNGQSLISSIFAAKTLLENGIKPAMDTAIIVVADEEMDNAQGILHIMDQGLLKKSDMIVVPDHGIPDGRLIDTWEKAIAWIKVTTIGKPCHTSQPNKGINAFRAAMRYGYLVDDALHKKFNLVDKIFDHPKSSFEPTKKVDNVQNINTIPGEDIFFIDCRLLPQYKIDDLMSEMRSVADSVEIETNTKIHLEYLLREDAAAPMSSNAPIIQKLKAAIESVYHNDPYTGGIGGSTCAGVLRRAGYHAVAWETVEGNPHIPNEFIQIDNMMNDCKVFATLFLNQLNDIDDDI